MEKEIVWTATAQNDLWEIVSYLKESWPEKVLDNFQKTLLLKSKILLKHPRIGFKSRKHSQFRKTLVTKHLHAYLFSNPRSYCYSPAETCKSEKIILYLFVGYANTRPDDIPTKA